MRLSRGADYALHAVAYLSRQQSGKVFTINEISAGSRVPRAFLAKLMPLLIRANIVLSVQGPRGGYRLARLPETITFLEALEAIEGPILPSGGLNSGPGWDPDGGQVVGGLMTRAQKVLANLFRGTTFADLAQAGRQKES